MPKSYFQLVYDQVEQHLGDVITEDMDFSEQCEECWTLAIDAANDLCGRGHRAIELAKGVCKSLGYVEGAQEPADEPDDTECIPVELLRPRASRY